MVISVLEYMQTPAFNPGIADLRQYQSQKWSWGAAVNAAQVSGAPQLLPAIPGVAGIAPSLDLYSTQSSADFLLGSSGAQYDFARPPQQTLWDGLGLAVLQLNPVAIPIYAELSSLGGGSLTPDVWSDFQRSQEFGPTAVQLGKSIDWLVGRASRQLARAAERAGRAAWRNVGKIARVAGLPTTPTGVAIYAATLVGEEVALRYASKGWKAMNRYLERQGHVPGNYSEFLRPWSPQYEPQSGARPVYGNTPRFSGPREVVDIEFLAFEVDGDTDDVPMVVPASRIPGLPPYLLNVGEGMFR